MMILIANPIGNFPLNDDWQYARPVWFLLNKGYYASTDPYSPILIAQVFWGALFCLPGGFSFRTLRISTMVLSLIGIIVFYFLLLKVSKNSKLSFLGALLLLANPIYISLSDSFMTDVPFLTFSIVSVYFFFCSIESNKRAHIMVATLFAIIATLIRQYGLVIPIAFAFASILKNKPKLLQSGKFILPAIITIIMFKLALLWLKQIGSELEPYSGVSIIEMLNKPADMYAHLTARGSLFLLYSGFFLLPLLLYTTWNARFRMTKSQKIALFFFVLFLVPLLVIWSQKLPAENILDTYGIGPRTLKGMEADMNLNPGFPPILLKILQIIAFSGAVLIVINLGRIIIGIIRAYIQKSFTNVLFMQMFVLFFIMGYTFLMVLPKDFFDRYLLPLIALSAILILAGIPGNIKIRLLVYMASCIIVIAMGFSGAAMTHDYFAWNRSRWQAIDYLTKDIKVSPHKIDGGYEFNGWVLDTDFPTPKNPNKSWWFVDDDEYVVAFHNFDGYTIIKQYSYQTYIPYEMKNIYILHRK